MSNPRVGIISTASGEMTLPEFTRDAKAKMHESSLRLFGARLSKDSGVGCQKKIQVEIIEVEIK